LDVFAVVNKRGSNKLMVMNAQPRDPFWFWMV